MPLRFAAIDFETANGSSASACSVGVVVVDDGVVVARHGWFIRPPAGHDVFSEWNIRIHGIRPEQVADAAGWVDQLPSLVGLIGDRPVVAHNARFDIGVIRSACGATRIPAPALDYFCSLTIARRTYALDSYRLPVAALAAGFEDFQHHDALADAGACAAIVLHAANRHDVDTVAGLLTATKSAMSALAPGDAASSKPMIFA